MPAPIVDTEEERQAKLQECLDYFTSCGTSASTPPPASDLISMLAHGAATRNMDRRNEYLGNILLLIVGGNDTTRNSITGGLLALNSNPDQYAEAARQPRADRQHGARDHPLADAAGPHAPHRARATSSSAARRSGRATRS